MVGQCVSSSVIKVESVTQTTLLEVVWSWPASKCNQVLVTLHSFRHSQSCLMRENKRR